MKKKKSLIIIPIILIILIIIGAGGFAFIYFQTDLFKSPKTLFYKYVGQTLQISDTFDYDNFLSTYKSISEKSYKSTGEISLDINTDISDAKEIAEILNDSKLNYTFNTIPQEQKSHLSLDAKYKSNDFTSLELLNSGDNYGLKCEDLYNKYIYIENNNLQALAKRFGIDGTSIPDKIKKIDTYDLLYINKDTRNKIKDTYYNLIDQKLDNKKFTENKNVDTQVNSKILKTNSYSIELTQKELYELALDILETLKNDDTTLDLIIEKADKSSYKDSLEKSLNYQNTYLYNYTENNNLSTSSNSVTFDKEFLKDKIQNAIDNLNDELVNCEDSNKIKLTVYSHKGNTVKLELEIISLDDTKKITVELTKNNNEDNVLSAYVDKKQIIKLNYIKTKEKFSGNGTLNLDYTNIPFEFNIESNNLLKKANFKITLPYDEFSSELEDYLTDDIEIEINSEISGEFGKGTNSNNSYVYIGSGNNTAKLYLKEDINYTDNIKIEELNSSNGICLNTASKSEIETSFKEIISNFYKVFLKKLNTLEISPSNFNNEEINANNNNTNNSSDENNNELNTSNNNSNILNNNNNSTNTSNSINSNNSNSTNTSNTITSNNDNSTNTSNTINSNNSNSTNISNNTSNT